MTGKICKMDLPSLAAENAFLQSRFGEDIATAFAPHRSFHDASGALEAHGDLANALIVSSPHPQPLPTASRGEG